MAEMNADPECWPAGQEASTQGPCAGELWEGLGRGSAWDQGSVGVGRSLPQEGVGGV